jgi:two-component system, NarL family, response regulator LiaR
MTLENLTRREREVFHSLVEGKFYKEISAEKFISVNTVKKHLKNIYRKLGTHKRKLIEEAYKSSQTADTAMAS